MASGENLKTLESSEVKEKKKEGDITIYGEAVNSNTSKKIKKKILILY